MAMTQEAVEEFVGTAAEAAESFIDFAEQAMRMLVEDIRAGKSRINDVEGCGGRGWLPAGNSSTERAVPEMFR
jgi:hypothetical protein